MQKLLSKIIAVSLVLALLSPCLSGCKLSKAETGKLWVLAENTPLWEESQNGHRQRFTAYLHNLYGFSESDINLEFLPENSDERATRLAALRTEIMAGGGPDIFILYSAPASKGLRELSEKSGLEDNLSYESRFEREPLFSDLQATMRNRIFLPLDNYIEKAKYFDKSLVLPVVLEAGKTEEGQVVLPITFTFPYAVFESNLLQDSVGSLNSWKCEFDSNIPAIYHAYAEMAEMQFSCLFSDLADYSTGKLAFTRAELLARVNEVLKMKQQIRQDNDKTDQSKDGFLCTRLFDHTDAAFMSYRRYYETKWQGTAIWDAPESEYRRDIEENPQIMEALHNLNGGLTAGVTAYVSINRNTKCPETAFQVVDSLFRTEFQSCYGELYTTAPDAFQCFILSGCFGIPIRNDLLKDSRNSFGQIYFSQIGVDSQNNEKLFSEYTALRNEVTHARFYGALDQELQTMYEACLEAKTDEEIEKIVSKAYDTMLMILAES